MSASASIRARPEARVSTKRGLNGEPPVRIASPGARAGIRPGDVVIAIDGRAIRSTDAFIASIETHKPGETLTLTIKRGSQRRSLKLTLGMRPNTP